MDLPLFIAQLLQSTCRMLQTPAWGLGWQSDQEQVYVLTVHGAPFTTPAVQHYLQAMLPSLRQPQPTPHFLPAADHPFIQVEALLLVPALPLPERPEPPPDAGLLLGLPKAITLSATQWQALQAIGQLLTTALSHAQPTDRERFSPQSADQADLVARLHERTRELQRAYEAARYLSQVRTQVLQNVSHELRTPLSIILGYTEMLAEGVLGDLTPQQKQVVQVIIQRAQMLQRQIQSLTTLQSTRPEEFSWLSLAELAAALQEEFLPQATRQNIQLVLECPPTLPLIPADRERLYLALSHLVENAIKFSPQGGTVTFRACVKPPWLTITIADQGIGMDPQHLQVIFEPFYQIDGSTRRRFGGMGIGLTLASDIITAHGGQIHVQSQPGQGSTFTVLLPLKPPLATSPLPEVSL